jgi:hypothetical protein
VIVSLVRDCYSRDVDLSLADAEQAHRDLNGRKTTGKLLLLPLKDPICAQVREHQRLSFTVFGDVGFTPVHEIHILVLRSLSAVSGAPLRSRFRQLSAPSVINFEAICREQQEKGMQGEQ